MAIMAQAALRKVSCWKQQQQSRLLSLSVLPETMRSNDFKWNLYDLSLLYSTPRPSILLHCFRVWATLWYVRPTNRVNLGKI